MPKLRVIIGQGTSTEVFRNTADPGYETIVFGDRGLWAGIRGHKMGQPAHVLTLPGQPVPQFKAATGTTPGGMQNFMDSTNYQEKLIALSQKGDVRDGAVHLGGCTVTSIVRKTKPVVQYRIPTSGQTYAIEADQVILATGIGPQKALEFPIIGKPDGSRSFKQIQEGIDYINAGPVREGLRTVVVYGGGATSAWVVEQALSRKPRRFWWVARPGGSGFSKANLPGQRNQMVLDATADLRELITIKSLTYLAKGDESATFKKVRKAKLEMKFEWDKQPGQDCYCLVDQFIYSVAGDPALKGSVTSLLGTDLSNELVPILDANQVLGGGNDILAVGTPSRDVLVIGAAAFSGVPGGLKNLPVKPGAPMLTLPWGSQVPDGIAVAISTISALNSYVPITQVQGKDGSVTVSEQNINFNLADQDQIACYIAVFYPDMKASDADGAVQQIIAARSQKGVANKAHDKAFGISEDEARAIIERFPFE